MNKGKLAEPVLKRSIFKRIKNKRPEIVCGPAVGIDASMVKLEADELFVISTDSFNDINKDQARINIIKACNNIAASGAEAVGIMISAFLPEDMEEGELRDIIDQMEESCKELNIQAIGGHTQITDAVNKPMISVTAVGKLKEDKTRKKKVKAGQDIVVTKWIGLEGSSILAKEKEEIIGQRYKSDLINKAKGFDKYLSVLPEAATAVKSGASGMHDISQGGIMTALWELAEAFGVGLTIDLKKIPVKQETIEICEIFDINPYRMLSGGSLIIVCDNGLDMVENLRVEGIEASVIGKLTDSNDRVIINNDEKAYLDLPKPDELLKAL